MKKRIALSNPTFFLKLIEKSLTQKIEKLSPLVGVIHSEEEKKIKTVLQKLNNVLQTKNIELEKLLYFLRNPKTLIYLQGSSLRKSEHHPIPPKDIDLLLLTSNEYLPKPICLKKVLEIEKGEIKLDINIYRHHGYPLSLIGRSLPECIVAELRYEKERLIFNQYCTYNPKLIASILREKQIRLPSLFQEIPYFLNPYHAFFSKRMVYAKLSESIIHKNPEMTDKVIDSMLESLRHYEQWIFPEDVLKIRHGIKSIEKKLKISKEITLLEKELSDIVKELKNIEEEEKEALVSELKLILKDLKKIRKSIKKISTSLHKNLQKELYAKEALEKAIAAQNHPMTKKENIFSAVEKRSGQEIEKSSGLEKKLIHEKPKKKTETKVEKKLREWEEFKVSLTQLEEKTLCKFLHQGHQITRDVSGLSSEQIIKGLLDLLKSIKPLLTEKMIKRFEQHDYEAYHDLLILLFKKQPETNTSSYFIPHTLISLKDSLIGSCYKIKYLTLILKLLLVQKPLGFEEEFIEILDKMISLDIKENPLAPKILDMYFIPSLFDQGHEDLNKRLWKLFTKSIIPYMEKTSSLDHQKIFPSIKWGLKNGYNEVFSYLIKFQKFVPYELLKPMLDNVITLSDEMDEDILEKKSETITLISLYLTSRITEVAIKKAKPDISFLELIEKTVGYFKEFILGLSKYTVSLYSMSQLRAQTIPIWERLDRITTVSAAIIILETAPQDLSVYEVKEKKIINQVIPFLKKESFNIIKSIIVLIIGTLKNSSSQELSIDLEKKLPHFIDMFEEFEELSGIEGPDIEDASGIQRSEFRTDLTKIVKEADKDIYQAPWFSCIRKVIFKQTLLGIPLLFKKTNLEEIKEKINIFFSKTLNLSKKGFYFEKNQNFRLSYRSHILDEIHLLFRKSLTQEPKKNHDHYLNIFLIFCNELLNVLKETNTEIEEWHQTEKERLKTEDEETQKMIELIKKRKLPLVNAQMKLTSLEKKKLKEIESLDQAYKEKIELEIQANTKKPNLLNSLHQEILIALKFLQLLHDLNQTFAEEKIKELLKTMIETFQEYRKKTQSMIYEISYVDESHKPLYEEIEKTLKGLCG